MRIAGKILLGLLILILVLAIVGAGLFYWTIRRSWPQTSGTLQVAGLKSEVEVVRDGKGVPNIYADNVEDLYTALGYVHAQDRFWEMDFRRHITSGRLSEMFGKDQVDTDAFLRTMGWRRVAEQEYQMLSPQAKTHLNAYADGVNRYLSDKSSAEISLEYVFLGLQNSSYQIEKWNPVDSVAWLKALAWDLNGNYDAEIARVLFASKVGVQRTEQLFPQYPYVRNGTIMSDAENRNLAKSERRSEQELDTNAAAMLGPKATAAFERVAEAGNELDQVLGAKGDGIGSDSWVVGGDLTQTGKPILSNDPHLAPSMPSLWYQAGLHCRTVSQACQYDVSGWTMAGLPGVFIGHNADMSWGFTNLGPDVSDLVLERVDGDAAIVDGKRVPLRTRKETIKVAGGDPVTITVRSTANGPLLSDVPGEASDPYQDVGTEAPVPAPGQTVKVKPAPRGDGYAVAMKWTALTPRPTYDAFDALDTAKNWREFREAARLLAVPSQNLIYADNQGNIAYQAPGEIPIRKGYDGKWPVPGWDSGFKWTGFIPFDDLPRIVNPPAGWITTANQAVVPKSFPEVIQADTYSYGARAKRINTRIATILNDGKKLSIADMNAIQMDAGNDFAAFVIPRIKDFRPGGNADQAMQLFADWDYQQPASSAAGAYFNVFFKNLIERMFTDELGDSGDFAANAGDQIWETIRTLWPRPNDPWWDDVATPQKETRDQTVNAALAAAADQLVELQGSDPAGWTWGDLHQLTATNQTLGKSGISLIERVFNRGPIAVGGGGSIPEANAWAPSEGYGVTWIPSMRQVVDFADFDASTWVNFTGNSGHAYNANYVDQLDAWAAGQTYPWPFSRDAVQANAANTLTLQP